MADPQFDHIDEADRERVRGECAAAEKWLADKLAQQAGTPRTQAPAVLSKEIAKKADALALFARPILSKPRPKPAAPPPPPPPPQPQPQPSAGDSAPTPMESDASAASPNPHGLD